jgi:hypothetical protein
VSSVGETLVIRRAADLGALRRSRTRWRAISLDAPSLPLEEQARWQSRLAHDYGGCGCETGRSFLLAGLIGIVALIWLTWGREDWSRLERGLWSAGIVFGAALLGKLVGLLAAHLRLRRSLQELSALLG